MGKIRDGIDTVVEGVVDFVYDYTIDLGCYLNHRRYLKKVRAAFYELLTPESRTIIEHIESSIAKILTTIDRTSAWWRYENYSFHYEDNFINQDDPEFAEHDSYEVYRDEDGYHAENEKYYGERGYWGRIAAKEMAFLNKYKDLLAHLHVLLNEREKFYNGDYKLKDESFRDIANKLLVELGKIKSKEKKEPEEKSMSALKLLRKKKNSKKRTK